MHESGPFHFPDVHGTLKSYYLILQRDLLRAVCAFYDGRGTFALYFQNMHDCFMYEFTLNNYQLNVNFL